MRTASNIGPTFATQDVNNETLFGTMEKTLHLLEMGFSENQISWAIENFGGFLKYFFLILYFEFI